MNNSTFSCVWTSSLAPFTNFFNYLTYTALSPFFFILGIIGHVVALLAFARQRKTEAAYAYQVFVTVIKTIEILFFNLWLLFFVHFADQDWSGQKGDNGWFLFRKNYALMWFTARITTILQSASITLPILATAAMAADRVLSLWKPIFYKSMNKRKHQLVAYCICCGISLSVSVDNSFRWIVSDSPVREGYKILATTFSRTAIGGVASQLRNFVRFVTEFVLIFCSIAMILLYRNYVNKVHTISQNDEREAAMKSTQRMMFHK